MKKLITTAVLFISITTFAQVGINNTSPKATLDISPKTTDGSKPEGLLIPQLDGNTLKATAYGTAQKGVIVYAKSAASPTDTKTANVTAEGYYYYDGSVWQKMTGAASGDTTNDAWINDTTNGLVKLGTNADGTARSAGTDFVAKDDGSIGIGIITPAEKLDVNGNMILRNSAVSGGTVNLSIRSTNGTNRWGIGMDNVETGSGNTGGDLKIWNYADDGGYISSPLMIKRSSGSVGIGTDSPTTKVHIKGDGTNSPLRLENTPIVTGPYSALAINNATGNIGTYTAGTSPILIVGYTSANALDGNPGLNTNGQSANWKLNTSSKNIIINTLGGTFGADATRDYISIPSSGIYRVEANGTFVGTPAFPGAALNLSFSSAPSGSSTYTAIQRNRMGSAQTDAYQPFFVAAYLNLNANDKLGLAEVFAGTGSNISLAQGSGITYAVIVTITKL